MIVTQAIISGLIIGALYGLAAIGLGLVFGVMKYLNIAHGSFIMLGGYASYWLFALLHLDPFISLPLVMLIMFIMGLIFYRILLAPLSKFSEDLKVNNSLLITFGLIMVVDNSATLLWTSWPKSITTLYSGAAFNIFGIRLTYIGLGGMGLAIVIILALHLFLTKTYFGKAITAIAQDWEAASLMGINIDYTYLISCALAITLGGVAGVLIVLCYSVTPSGGFSWLMIAFIVVTLAGMGNLYGIFAAGLLLGVSQAVGSLLIGSSYQGVIGFAILLLTVLFRPDGIFTRKRKGYAR